MLSGVFPDNVTRGIDFADEALVQCDVPAVNILLQVMVMLMIKINFDVNTVSGPNFVNGFKFLGM